MTMRLAVSFGVGFLFAIGLVIAGMTHPSKILGFLNLVHNWDPSLAFVMMGAIPVHMLAYRWIRKWKKPALDTFWHIPKNPLVTKSLLLGSVLFGVGWGIGGFCPGPALASVFSGNSEVFVFLLAVTVGMYLEQALNRRLRL